MAAAAWLTQRIAFRCEDLARVSVVRLSRFRFGLVVDQPLKENQPGLDIECQRFGHTYLSAC